MLFRSEARICATSYLSIRDVFYLPWTSKKLKYIAKYYNEIGIDLDNKKAADLGILSLGQMISISFPSLDPKKTYRPC